MEEKETKNIYKVGEHYESHYDDDYCTFLYYNADTKKLFQDEWTTAFACPSYYSYPDTDIREGIESGKVAVDDIVGAVVEELDNKDAMKGYAKNIIDGMLKLDTRYNLPCTVKGGRKFKGDAILIDVVERTFDMGYNRTGVQHIARLLTSDNTIATATAHYVHVNLSEEEIANGMRANLYSMAKDKEGFLRTFLTICGTNGAELGTYKMYVRSCLFPITHEYDKRIEKALEADRKAKADKHLQWLKDKRVSLLQWCKIKFTDKTEEQLQSICDRIMKKKYGVTCATA